MVVATATVFVLGAFGIGIWRVFAEGAAEEGQRDFDHYLAMAGLPISKDDSGDGTDAAEEVSEAAVGGFSIEYPQHDDGEADGGTEDAEGEAKEEDSSKAPSSGGMVTSEGEVALDGGSVSSSGLYELSAPVGSVTSSVLWVGDSVSVLSKSAVQAAIPDVVLDAVSGRTLVEGLESVRSKGFGGSDFGCVVIELGANSVEGEAEFKGHYAELIDLFDSDVPIYAVTVKTAGTYHDQHNRAIKELVDERENVYLVDWNGLAAKNPGWLSDGCHPIQPDGVNGFVRLVTGAIGG